MSEDVRPALALVTSGLARVATLPALRRAAPYVRTQLAHQLRLRVAPQVSFQPDTALEYAMHVDRLLRAPDVARDLGADPAVPRD